MTCQQCQKYKKFIHAMIAEFDRYGANKTAAYYKQQCEKILAGDKNIK
jgi:hypothetical protein